MKSASRIPNQRINRSDRRNPSTRRIALCLEALESREVRSVANLWTSGATVFVKTDDYSTGVEVVQSGSHVAIVEVGTNRVWSYSGVGRVEFQGGAGDDRFVNKISWLPITAFGFAGNDYLEGYSGNDTFVGGPGNDKLFGYGGDDLMWGGAGNDVLLAGGGNDQMWGGPGNDRLNGRAGYDKYWGGYGSDVLIAIDETTGDEVRGGPDGDVIWVDRNNSVNDPIYGSESIDKLQHVPWFANGADRSLNGDKIADPWTKSGHSYKSFAGNPLFSSSGPSTWDIRQGDLSDCWILAGLGAIAHDNPGTLRSYIVNFDDGTYGVRLGSNYYRVDSDLPVAGSSSTTPAYAQLGANKSMWVAIVEKAYAHYRTGANSYASLEFGWSVDLNKAFGTTVPGDYAISGYGSATAMANAISNLWNKYEAVTIGFAGGSIYSGAPLVNNHMYTVHSVTLNGWGAVASITLRNPWGTDGAGNDGNTNDGLVTLTPTQIFGSTGRINWGRV
jgi:hypothetical protein